jgi:hypothetical protein
VAKLKEGKRTKSDNAFGKVVFTEETVLLVQEDEGTRLVYDIGALLDEYEGDTVTITIKREQTLATANPQKPALKGVRNLDLQNANVPTEPKEAE